MIEYFLEKNRVLKQQFDQVGKKLRLDNQQPVDSPSAVKRWYGIYGGKFVCN